MISYDLICAKSIRKSVIVIHLWFDLWLSIYLSRIVVTFGYILKQIWRKSLIDEMFFFYCKY